MPVEFQSRVFQPVSFHLEACWAYSLHLNAFLQLEDSWVKQGSCAMSEGFCTEIGKFIPQILVESGSSHLQMDQYQ